MISQKPDRKNPTENRGNIRHTVSKKPVNPGGTNTIASFVRTPSAKK